MGAAIGGNNHITFRRGCDRAKKKKECDVNIRSVASLNFGSRALWLLGALRPRLCRVKGLR